MTPPISQGTDSQDKLRQAVFVCKCLSDPLALKIGLLLYEKPRTIAELQRELSRTREQVNERLRKMRAYSIVEAERSERWLLFHLTDTFLPVLESLIAMEPSPEVSESQA